MNSTTRIVIALLLCLAFCRPAARRLRPACSTHTPVTMQQAVEQALAHNPVLLAAQQNLLSMKGQEVEAGLRANPDSLPVWQRYLAVRQRIRPVPILTAAGRFSLIRARAEAALAPG